MHLQQFFLLKIDSARNLQFARPIIPTGSISDLNIARVQQAAYGGYAFAGLDVAMDACAASSASAIYAVCGAIPAVDEQVDRPHRQHMECGRNPAGQTVLRKPERAG